MCPGTLREASLEEIALASAAAGCTGMSARPQAVADAVARLGSVGAVRRFLADTGVAIADFDALVDWDCAEVVVPDYMARTGLFDQQAVLDLAAEVGARSINIVELANSVPAEVLIEPFARTCERAAQRGLLVHVEFFAISAIKDIASAAMLVRQADQANGGVLFDAFHYHRGPRDAANRLEDHASLITMLQLNDAGPLPGGADISVEMLRGRMLPGKGEIDLPSILTTLRAAGVDAPIGIEVFNDTLHAMEPMRAAKLAADAMRSVLAGMESTDGNS